MSWVKDIANSESIVTELHDVDVLAEAQHCDPEWTVVVMAGAMIDRAQVL